MLPEILTHVTAGASAGGLWSLAGYVNAHIKDAEGFDFGRFLITLAGGAIVGGVIGFIAGPDIEDYKDFISLAAASGAFVAYAQKLWKAYKEWRAQR